MFIVHVHVVVVAIVMLSSVFNGFFIRLCLLKYVISMHVCHSFHLRIRLLNLPPFLFLLLLMFLFPFFPHSFIVVPLSVSATLLIALLERGSLSLSLYFH